MEPQRGNRRPGFAGPRIGQVLPVDLGRGVGVARIERCRLLDQSRNQIAPAGRASWIKTAGGQICPGTRRRDRRSMPSALVCALAIDHHGGGTHEPTHMSGTSPQDNSSAKIVGPDIVVHIVKADTDTDLGRQMDDGVAAFHRRSDALQVGDVIPCVERTVEDRDVSPGLTQRSFRWAADEASSASEQHLHERTLWFTCGSASSKQQPVSVLRTEILPWWASTTPRAMARPRPAPPSVMPRAGLPPHPVSKTRSRYASGIPPHQSCTAIRTEPSAARAADT